MSFFEKISPGYTPQAAIEKGSLFVIRERILQSMLLLAAVIGLPAVILGSRASILQHEYYLLFVYALVYTPVLISALVRNLSFEIRGWILVMMLYLLAVSELFESGQLGDVRMFLLTYVALISVLFRTRSVIFAMVLSLGTIMTAGIYAAATPNPIIPALAHLREGTDWVTGSILFTLIASLVSGSISMIINGLESNLKNQADLAHKLEHERDLLEGRIQERTNTMSRQVVQLHAAAEISHAISGLSDPETLLQRVVELIQERFGLYYTGVFLIDASRQYAVLSAGTGEAGKRMLAQKHQLSVGGSSMIGWAIVNRKARIALDVGAESVRFNNPHLPLTRSELAIPVIAYDQVLGAMTVQSEKPNAFNENDITILESVADSLAIAIENDRLYHETRQGMDEIRALNHQYLQQAWSEALDTYNTTLSYDYQSPNVPAGLHSANTIQVPLLLRDEVMGQITLEMDRTSLSEDENSFINQITTQTALALENARLLHETERRAVQEQKLNELTTRFSRALSIDEILRSAAQELGQLPAVAEVSVQLSPMGSVVRSTTSQAAYSRGNGKEHLA